MIKEIAETIERDGPLPLARAMALAANHYYATREPFGTTGDFVTSPEISQIFGELVGLFFADLWARAGSPSPFLLVEAGPGRGTLMADMLRACRHALPAFAEAAQLHLIEQSPRLRAIQQRAFPSAIFHERLDTLPTDAPLLFVANEFLDALPLTQFERTDLGWALRAVTADGWDLSTPANIQLVPEEIRDAVPGSVYERNFAAETLVAGVARRIAAQGGAALIIDYGYSGPALGDTLQSIHHGQFADVLQTLGEADISAHVDFTAMARAARPHATVYGPIDQGVLLLALGIRARADRLRAAASIETRAEIEAAVARLTSPGSMGRLFQALAFTAPGWPQPSGFPTSTR
ncbi:MAG: SAM-dependent methyltransferase [Sphingomonadaceae bacterium]